MGFDLSPYLSTLAFDIITFRSQTKTLAANGTYSTSEVSGSPVRCSVQPLEGYKADADLALIRSTAGVTVYTDQDLNVGEPGGEPGDRFTWSGRTYEIRHKKDWGGSGGFRTYLAGLLS